MGEDTCRVAICPLPTDHVGYCNGHYARWKRLGDDFPQTPIRERLAPRPGAKCAAPSCDEPLYAKGVCRSHYSRLQRKGSPDLDRPLLKRPSLTGVTCAFEGCDSPAKARFWCHAHYVNWCRHGDPARRERRPPKRATCSREDCARPAREGALCRGHRGRQRRTRNVGGGTFRAYRRWGGAGCSVATCPRPVIANGTCKAHYYRFRKTGDLRPDVPLGRRRPEGLRCSGVNCVRLAKVGDLCGTHCAAKYRAAIAADPVRLEAARKASREWKAAEYRRNPGAVRARHRAWKARNPERMKLIWAVSQRRRAAATKLPFTAAQLRQKLAYWGFRCWMCRGPYEAVDHVKPIAKGGWHALMNLRPSCTPCNSAKRARWPYPVATR